jgi:hypothetical protein
METILLTEAGTEIALPARSFTGNEEAASAIALTAAPDADEAASAIELTAAPDADETAPGSDAVAAPPQPPSRSSPAAARAAIAILFVRVLNFIYASMMNSRRLSPAPSLYFDSAVSAVLFN